MPSPLPQPDVSGFERTASLLKFKDQLLNNNSKTRYECLYYYIQAKKYCSWNCEHYKSDHPGNFDKATNILAQEVDKVRKEDFIAVLRTFFCKAHDLTQSPGEHKAYRNHFEALWEGASREMQSAVWDALRKSGRGIYSSSTPQRRHRPQTEHINSAPARVPQNKLKAARDIAPASPNIYSDNPSRPRTAQAKIDNSAESLLDDIPVASFIPALGSDCILTERDISAGTPSPSPLPSHSTLQAHLQKPGAKQPSKTFARDRKHEVSLLNMSNATEDIQFPHLKQEKVERIEGESFWAWARRDVGEPKVEPWNESKEIKEHSKGEKIFQLKINAKGSTADNVGDAENSKQPPAPTAQTECCLEKQVMQASANDHEDHAYQSAFVIREKPSVAPEHRRKQPVLGYSSPPHDDSFESPEDAPELENETVKTDSLPPSNTPSLNHETPFAKCCKTAPSPAFKHYLPETIATTISKILQKRLMEERTGAIYVLEAPEFFSTFPAARCKNEQWIKIGISSDVHKRMKTLEVKCGITDVKEVYI